MATARKKTVRQQIKDILHQVHLIGGLVSGIVVLIVGITGALFVFEEEGRELLQHKYYHVAGEGRERLPVGQLVDSFTAHYPKQKIGSIRFKEEKDAAFVFYTKDRLVSMNPYTGAVTGVRNPNTDFFMVVQKIHTGLLLGKVGKQIVRWNVLIFFIMCISGLVVWWPKQKRFFRQAVRINFKTKNWKRLNWDLHSVLGFYAVFVLLIISSTGLFWVFDTARNIVGFATQSPVTAREEKVKSKVMHDKRYSLDEAYRYASAGYPGATETFIMPAADSTAPVRVLMRYPYTIVRKQNTLFFNQYTGKVLKQDLYASYTRYDKVARSNYDFHTGRIRVLGIGSKIIYFLAALMAASLPVTGFMIWWGKRKKKAPVRSYARVQEASLA
jgi:uncharacterized iron-regulated membrane protein